MLNKLKLLLGVIFVSGVILSIDNKVEEPNYMTFDNVLQETQQFYKDVVGKEVDTPIRDFNHFLYGDQSDNVLAYCYLKPGEEYIAFNHDKIKEVNEENGNADFVFQVILHEYTHCQGRIGHIQMGGHFMNDGGNPELSKKQVKQQFKDYVKYYRTFYNSFAREEENLNDVYALKIWKDSNGNIKTSCTCSTCVK